MGIAILDAGYPIRESKCWSLPGMRDGEVFKVFLDAIESVKREMKDVKIIAAVGSGRRFKTYCPVECVRPSDDGLARLYFSCDAFVMTSLREGLNGTIMEAMACGGAVAVTNCLGIRDHAIDDVRCLVVPELKELNSSDT